MADGNSFGGVVIHLAYLISLHAPSPIARLILRLFLSFSQLKSAAAGIRPRTRPKERCKKHPMTDNAQPAMTSNASGRGRAGSRWRARLRRIVDSRVFHHIVVALIILNAVVLGLETLPVAERMGGLLMIVDRAILWSFVVEIILRLLAYRRAYVRNGWNVFDILVVAVSLVAASSGLAALRAFRVLRILRVITIFPRMRVVVSALIDAIPGIASVGVVVLLINYVFAVIAANLYGAAHPNYFGDVFTAMYTLFQIMTLENWSEIAADVAATHPNSWAFFLAFILIATFTMLNLFVAIVVRVVEEDSDELHDDLRADIDREHRALSGEISELTNEVKALRAEIAAERGANGQG